MRASSVANSPRSCVINVCGPAFCAERIETLPGSDCLADGVIEVSAL